MREQAPRDERDIVQFLIAEPENPGSISASFKMARENARTLRDICPTEAWELLNEFFMEFIAGAADGPEQAHPVQLPEAHRARRRRR